MQTYDRCSLVIKSLRMKTKIIGSVYMAPKAVARGLAHSSKPVNSIPYDKILDLTKLKAFAENKLNVSKMTISPYDRVVQKEKMSILV